MSAMQLINEKGYENVLVDEITSSAGFAKGSFYNHFQSKEQLLFYIHQLTDQLYADAYVKSQAEGDFYDRFYAFITLSYSEVEKLGKEVMRAICMYFSIEESKEIYSNKERSLYTSLTGLVEYGKEVGVIRAEYETSSCVEKILITIIGIDNYWSSIEESRGLAEMAKETLTILVRGFSAKTW